MTAYNSILVEQLIAAIVRNAIAPDDRQAAEEAAYLLYVTADLIGADAVQDALREARVIARRASMVIV